MIDRGKIYRLYAPALATTPAEVSLPAGEVHHALHVLRLREGDEVEVFDGAGRRADARVCRVGRSEMSLTVGAISTVAERPWPRVHLAFAVPKGDRLDWLLEKATEMGAASFRPIVFERSLVGRQEFSEKKPAKRLRWQMTCISAAKQSGLDFLPELCEPADLATFLMREATGGRLQTSGTAEATAPGVCCPTPEAGSTASSPPSGRPCDLRLVGDLSPDARPLRDVVMPSSREVSLLIGPEGGFTADEVLRIREAGFTPVRLGSTTLRIETAALALLAAIRCLA